MDTGPGGRRFGEVFGSVAGDEQGSLALVTRWAGNQLIIGVFKS